MPAQWTGDIVSKMHIFSITQTELAQKLGCSRAWVNAVLNGKQAPEGAEERFRAALDELIGNT